MATEVLDVRRAYLQFLYEDVEKNLERFDEDTGRFLTGGGWAVTNQDIVYPLALLYKTADPDNPYAEDPRILNYALLGGDAWRDFQYPDGRVEFVKIDGSKWGPTFMPWSMYHWLETYALLRDELGAQRKSQWEEGLTLAYDGICGGLDKNDVHNIPTWNGMASYRAGQLFERSDWKDAGSRMIARAVESQTDQGCWFEHGGPTTRYNLVYVHAIGLYQCFSGDESVLPTLERALDFHIRYSYPDGSSIETIDGRVKYHSELPDTAQVAFNLLPKGRAYARMLVEETRRRREEAADAHAAGSQPGLTPRYASAFAHFKPGPEQPSRLTGPAYHVHGDGYGITRRKAGWVYCLSGVAVPPVESRWGQDRQNYVSLWHEKAGLIVGGGNSKGQPAWSTFVIGEGDAAAFLPDKAQLNPGEVSDSVSLTYAGAECEVTAKIGDDTGVELTLRGPQGGETGTDAESVLAQLTLKLMPGLALTTAAGESYVVGDEHISLSRESAGEWVAHNGWKLYLPTKGVFEWPVPPFNPYTKDGSSSIEAAAAVCRVRVGGEPVTVLIESIDED